MSAEFIDTNVFVYLFDDTAPSKREAAQRIVQEGLESGNGCISFQVVQETINVILRKIAVPASPEDARRLLDGVLAPMWRVMPSPGLYHRALDIQARFRHGFHDSLIIAAALESGCTRLWSEDLQDGQRIDGLRIENPFKA
jgi:predicted nucleic acid-binding protein